MAKASVREYGHAKCPRCERDFNIAEAAHTLCITKGNEEVYLYLCCACAPLLSGKTDEQIKSVIYDCWKKLEQNLERARSFAVLTRTALVQHGGDVARALEIGTYLPKRLHDQILEGKAEIGNILGMTIICSTADEGT